MDGPEHESRTTYLYTFPILRTPVIDMFARSITANEANRLDGGVIANCIDSWHTAVNNIEHTVGETFKESVNNVNYATRKESLPAC